MNRLGGGSRGRLGSGFVPNLAPISSHSLQRQTSMENLRPLESTLMHHSSRAAFPPAPTNLPYREPANIDPFSSPLPSISPPPHIGYIQSQSTSTPSPSYTSYRQTPPNLSYGSSSYFAGPSTPLASAPRDADPAASANTPQFSSLQLASPYTTHFDRSSQSGSQNLPPLLPLMPQPDNRGMLNSGSTGEDGREPYVLPLHPYGSDGFLDDALAHGPAPPRHAFRRRRSEASLSPPPLSSGSSGGFGSTSSARTSPHPHSHTDPFDPLPAHDFTHQGTSAPRRTEAGHALRGQRSLIVPSSRSRRYLPPPNPLESLIGSSGMLQSADASSSSINIPGLGGTHAGSQPARYACELCGKGFTRPSALAIHMNSHVSTQKIEPAAQKWNSNSRRMYRLEHDHTHASIAERISAWPQTCAGESIHKKSLQFLRTGH